MLRRPSYKFLILIQLFSCLSAETDSPVVTLKDQTWDETIQGIWIVKFYAPWCGHCKKFAPIFEEAAIMTQETDGYVNYGEMDCDSNLIVCGEYHVTGYPTILLLYNGKLIAKYKGSRDSPERVKSWILEQLDSKELRSGRELNEQDISDIEVIRSGDYSSGGDDWFPIYIFNKMYERWLGDVHPTVPFVVFVIGTMFGLAIGVMLTICMAD